MVVPVFQFYLSLKSVVDIWFAKNVSKGSTIFEMTYGKPQKYDGLLRSCVKPYLVLLKSAMGTVVTQSYY